MLDIPVHLCYSILHQDQTGAIMTIREHLESLGTQNGLFPEQAQAIAQALIDEDSNNENLMAGRWDECSDAYPPQLMAVLWHSYKRVASNWLAVNKPMHWARGMFDPKFAPDNA
jgi:hypothetical protein